MAETRKVGAEIAAGEPRIDVLINNAGALFSDRRVTPEGLELTFALNHMAYFVLTEALRDKLVASAPARIVSTSSTAHQGARLDFDDLQSAKGYGGLKVYGRSKLANILFTRELARRLAGTGVTANCLHPGVVATRFGESSGGFAGLSDPFPEAVLHLSREGRRHDRLSRLLAGGRRHDRRLFRQAQDHRAVRGGAGRCGGEEAVGGERGPCRRPFAKGTRGRLAPRPLRFRRRMAPGHLERSSKLRLAQRRERRAGPAAAAPRRCRGLKRRRARPCI